MQKCWNCDAKNLDGTVFCTECGASLLGVQQGKETTTSLQPQTESEGALFEPVVVAEPQPTAPVGENTFFLVILNSGRRITLDKTETILLGREDSKRGIRPTVDLGMFGGYDAGVSRRHASIVMNQDELLLEDLGSANGTFLNGQQLEPGQPQPLHHGDELMFGTLLLRVEM
ncbi:MAG: FHA domain-containing protein [Chloroflexaceae bacterium]|nr:FHA domain-containing protein [Chloroflexaceae bacterium]